MKQVIITGNVTKDAVTRSVGQDSVTSFSVAVNDRKTRDAFFFDCSLWGLRGAKVAQYLTKGTTVSVIGDLGRREHEGRTYITVNVSELTLAGGGKRQEEPQRDSYGNDTRDTGFSRDLDDDIPF